MSYFESSFLRMHTGLWQQHRKWINNKPGIEGSVSSITTSLGGPNLEVDDWNEPYFFLASSVLGFPDVFFSCDFIKDLCTSYDPGGGFSCKYKMNIFEHFKR